MDVLDFDISHSPKLMIGSPRDILDIVLDPGANELEEPGFPFGCSFGKDFVYGLKDGEFLFHNVGLVFLIDDLGHFILAALAIEHTIL